MGLSMNTLVLSLTITLSFSLMIPPPTNAQPPKPAKSIPYETVNNFCLHKRLNVNKPFCLRILKNPKASDAKPDDLTPLLRVAINSTSIYVCKTLTILQDLYDDLKTKPSLIPAIDECLSAYEEIAAYITNVLSDASQESTIAGLDGEVIVDYINRCIKAVDKAKNPDISDRNREAKNYAKLLIDIADSLGSKEDGFK